MPSFAFTFSSQMLFSMFPCSASVNCMSGAFCSVSFPFLVQFFIAVMASLWRFCPLHEPIADDRNPHTHQHHGCDCD